MLKRRGYVRQDDETARYSLTLKMLDLSFRALGGSELRLHAYPLVRDYVLRTAQRLFLAIPAAGEVTYLWPAGPDEVAMRTVYGREMPGHCALYFGVAEAQATRRLSCLKLSESRHVRTPSGGRSSGSGPAGELPAGAQRLVCTCAPIRDYTTQEVGRVGSFVHGAAEAPLATTGTGPSGSSRATSHCGWAICPRRRWRRRPDGGFPRRRRYFRRRRHGVHHH